MPIDESQFKWACEELDPTEAWNVGELDRYRRAARTVIEFKADAVGGAICRAESRAEQSDYLHEGAIELANQEIMKRQDAEAVLRDIVWILLDEPELIASSPSVESILEKITAYQKRDVSDEI